MRFTLSMAAGTVFLASAAWAQPVSQQQYTLGACRDWTKTNLDGKPLGEAAHANLQERAAGGGGGLGQILSDHVKYVANPASAKEPIPADQNNAAREAHRSVHATLFDVIGGGGGRGAGAGAGAGAGKGGGGGGVGGAGKGAGKDEDAGK